MIKPFPDTENKDLEDMEEVRTQEKPSDVVREDGLPTTSEDMGEMFNPKEKKKGSGRGVIELIIKIMT